MQFICLLLIGIGAAIMLFSILKYYKSLVLLKIQAYEQKVFANWIYIFCLILMLFFLAGYVIVAIAYANQPPSTNNLLVSCVFFFGAFFVFTMVSIERRMSNTISSKTGEIVRTLVNAVEAKDLYTRGHSDHVLNIVRLFFSKLPEEITGQINLPWLMDAAILHDIGKIGIEDQILNKPGSLTKEELQTIQQHPYLGKKILENTSYNAIGDIICYHHERVDGTGYFGLNKDQIPIESKIIAIADTFSAIYTDRIYRHKLAFSEAMDILRSAAGSQLDAELVEIFCTLTQQELDSAGFVFSDQVTYVR